jgi:hypothetical protein
MPRARNIKPGFWTNESLGECSLGARLLFIGLWGMADFRGTLEYRHKRIKATIFPYDNIEIKPLIGELVKQKLIGVYLLTTKSLTALGLDFRDNTLFINVFTFVKHQHPHWTEVKKESGLPTVFDLETYGIKQLPAREGVNPAESRNLNPESRTPNPNSVTITPDKKSGKNEVKKKSKRKAARRPKYTPEFLAFKELYPKGKGSPSKAFDSWEKLDPTPEEVVEIMAALKLFVECKKWLDDDGEYIPHMQTWMNQSRWESPPAPNGAAQHVARTHGESTAEFIDREADEAEERADATPPTE